jgi:hypothetical protein
VIIVKQVVPRIPVEARDEHCPEHVLGHLYDDNIFSEVFYALLRSAKVTLKKVETDIAVKEKENCN